MKKSNSEQTQSKIRPALTSDAQEKRMTALAMDLAEKQLREGTASSQVITHFLKIASSRERIEKEILEKQKELISAKTESLQSAKRIEELFEGAKKAMMIYSGEGDQNGD